MRNSMRSMNGEWALVALFVLALLAPPGCARKDAESKTAADESAVQISAADIVVVGARRLEAGVTFTGNLAPVRVVEINARFDGDLDEVMAREGERIHRGQALAKYRPRDVNDKLQAAEAGVLAAQAGLAAAENSARRVQRLFEAGAASSSDVDAAEAQRTAAKAALDSALALRNRLQEDADRLDVPSPIDGGVSQVFVHGGDRTAVGDHLLTLVDTSTLELSATVPAEALGRVQPGAPIRFRVDGYPGETFEGKVDRLNPTTEPGTRQVRIYMRLPNPDGRLVGGLFASGRVIDAIRENATSAPIPALRKEGQEEVVYRLRDGRAHRVPVKTGLVDDEAGIAELIGNVSVGDSLLTGVLPGLRDGARVLVLRGAGEGNGAQAPAGR